MDNTLLILLLGIGLALVGLAHEVPAPWGRVLNIVGIAFGLVVVLVAVLR